MSLNRWIRFLKFSLIVATVAVTAVFHFAARRPSPTRPQPNTARDAPQLSGVDIPEHEAAMLSAALKRSPGHVPILLRLARLEAASGHPDAAVARLELALKQEPNNVEARLDLGKTLFEQGNIQAAVDQNNAILKIRPDHPDALYNLGAIYGNLGNARLAEHFWNRLLATDPGSESGLRARKMVALLNGGQNSTGSGMRWQ